LSFLLTAQEPVPLSVTHPRKIVDTISEDVDEFVADLTAMERDNRILSAAAAKGRIQELRAKSLQLS
jgi:hypothetical protein